MGFVTRPPTASTWLVGEDVCHIEWWLLLFTDNFPVHLFLEMCWNMKHGMKCFQRIEGVDCGLFFADPPSDPMRMVAKR